MYVITIVLSLIVAWLRGGRLARLAEFSFKMVWLILAAFLLRILVARLAGPWGLPGGLSAALYALSYALLLSALWYNRGAPGVPIVLAGVASNFLVIVLNRMRMPVSEAGLSVTGQEAVIRALRAGGGLTHTLMSGDTRLGFLGDLFHYPGPWKLGWVFSVGDFLIMLGLFVLVQGVAVVRRTAAAAPARTS